MGLFGKKKTPAEILEEGRSQYVKGDLKKAFLTLHGLAAKGDPQACWYVGRIYLERKERSLAQSFLTTAAKGGVQDAASLLAKEFGVRDYLPKETAPEEDITADKAFARGFDAYNGKNYTEALKWWEKAAQLGETAAQYNLGHMYHAGEGTDKNESKAFYWYRKSAEGGHPSGQYNTGVYYLYGVETPVDKGEALRWFRLAAEQGDENAKKQLAALTPKPEPKPEPRPEPAQKSGEELSAEEKYQKGMELFQAGKYDEALPLLRSVCRLLGTGKNKYPAGQAAIGRMYEQGWGVEADDSQALWRYRIAAGSGDRGGMAGFVRLTAKVEAPTLKDCEAALDYVKQLGTAEAKAAVPALEKKLAEAQLREKYAEWELTEANVQAIFNRCLATDNTTEHVKSLLYHKEWDYLKDSDLTEELTEELNEKLWYTGSDHLILFDKKALLDNLKSIRYLYGQLIAVHWDTNSIHTDEDSDSPVMKNYQGKIWTMNKGVLLQFFHLGVGSNTIDSFTRRGNSGFKYKIPVTLSPKDPNFPAWWAAHKGEWEQ